MQKRSMPSKSAITRYWINILWDLDEWNKSNEFCWACGFPAMTHRCHIKAKCDGGSDSVENLVLLCSDCHKIQEAQCCTRTGRRNFLSMLQDGAPYFVYKYRSLEAVFQAMPLTKQRELIETVKRTKPFFSK